MNTIYIKRICLTSLLLIGAVVSFAQTRTSYFMKNTPQRYTINPAMAPERGYFGALFNDIQFEYNSNALTLDNLIIPGNDGKNYLFYNAPNLNVKSFLGDLASDNAISANLGMNLINAGFWTNVGFFSIDINMKAATNFSISKGLFEFMLDGMKEGETTNYNFGIKGNATAYIETALGYSRPLNEQWSVGGKLKFYNGLGAANIDYSNINATLNGNQWSITSEGTVDLALKGASFETDTESTMNDAGQYPINGIEMDGFGLVGFGMGVDLGVEYKPLEDLRIGFSINDLGFINWSKGNVISAKAKGTVDHDGFDLNLSNDNSKPSLEDQIDDLADDLKDVFNPYETDESNSLGSGLTTKIHLGGEYDFLEKQLTVGLLSSTYINSIRTIQEISTAVSYTPAAVNWLSIALDYSWVNSGFKTIGWSVSLAPNEGARFFFATDYMIGKVAPQFIPISATAMNMEFGVSFLLGKKRSDLTAFNF